MQFKKALLKFASTAALVFIFFIVLNNKVLAAPGVQLSKMFPDNSLTSIDGSSSADLYLTIGLGAFKGEIAGATILSDNPGAFRLKIGHALFCDDLDLPQNTTKPYFETNFYVWPIKKNASNQYQLVMQNLATPVSTGFRAECDGSKNDLYMDITIPNDPNSYYLPSIKKWAVVAFGIVGSKNTIVYKNAPSATENSFRFQLISGPAGDYGMTVIPPSVAGANYFNFSNRNRAENSKLSTSIILTTPCSLASQPVKIWFYDTDDYVDYRKGRGDLQSYPNKSAGGSPRDANFPLNFNVQRKSATSGYSDVTYSFNDEVGGNTKSAWRNASKSGLQKVFGGDKEISQTFSLTLERDYIYKFIVSGLSRRNALSYNFSTDTDPLFVATSCTPPSGSINVSCSATGLVTITSATITDSQGGIMDITATKPGGAVATGSGSVTANRTTNINFTSSNTFNGTRDGVVRTISGKVTDPEGLASDISGTYKCDPPPLAIACILSDITIELGDPASLRMAISRTDTNNLAITAISSIVVNGREYANPAVSLNASSSSDQTFQSVTLSEEKSYDISGSVKRQSDNTTLATCASKINVVRKPFFKVSGGDLMVGAAYPTTSPTSCTGSTVGNVSSWATVNSATDRKGANVSAMSQILGAAKDFYSAGSTAPPSFPKKWLTIANNTGEWGSAYGQVTCMKDMYTLTKKTTSKTVSSPYKPSSVTSTDYQVVYEGNLELRGENNFTGKLAVYVTGNVYITEDIIMNSTYSNGIADIPFFALIVRGNIYVKSTVQRLDGLYVAQPRADNNGNFIPSTGVLYTCASAVNAPVVISSIFSSCSSPLNINGIVQAKDLKLHRTSGTLKNNSPAEVFNNLPELYLAQTPFRDSTSANTLYDSAASLPPSL